VTAKLLNIQVPYFFKCAIDALNSDAGIYEMGVYGVAMTPPSLLLLWGGSRLTASALSEVPRSLGAPHCVTLGRLDGRLEPLYSRGWPRRRSTVFRMTFSSTFIN
jgi:hypothetical protein